ncbi:3-phosphoshikimate 1-carboxyvinyltransferase [Sulfurospirillum multivorans]|uniref:3-phosphoshikimate 1-carboxyvinyltransferase n=2 Tax=Sulfurospirillum multivorans TaxID=66821 RepID=A0AA86AKS6_SULMK|nr:3-phosphoshikimate 1-carboxyvinyltransferase [Sulfurospirillum multivorans]AHJ12064.1 3-phosphoshikimate 1-carboxyvinyltransferase [Sulfurospirillum multivorans DSM 12446]QEH05565.1 3-phosphoshikimate 1-carboxyvinyltransferase [Sulfurospirillum multivorans]
MKTLHVNPKGHFSFTTDQIASDKSISHRCAIFSLLSDQPSIIQNYLPAEDTLCTLSIVQSLGAQVEKADDGTLTITPPLSIVEPPLILDCGNSGTAIRLLMGFLSTCKGFFVLYGDKYLCSRPMRRVADPLREIGAKIDGRNNGNYAPLGIRGETLKAFHYESKIASAQVKSALILAALQADGISTFCEPELSRDHSERMLRGMGANVISEGLHVTIHPQSSPLKPLRMKVPNDPSSGFFFAVAAAINLGSSVTLHNMLLNPTRIEAYNVLKRMGAEVVFIEKKNVYESVGDIIITGKELHGVEVSENISWLIDELPALSIAFACAKGKSLVKNAQELRVKESDRISSVVKNLRLCGIDVEEFEDGYEVSGGALKSATINSFGDHRIAMSFAIAGTKIAMKIEDIECINTSFPNFIELLSQIGKVEQ